MHKKSGIGDFGMNDTKNAHQASCVEKIPLFEKRYRILGLDLALTSDSQQFLHSFDVDYALFAISDARQSPHLACSFFKNDRNGGRLSINGVSHFDIESPGPAVYPYQILTGMVMKEIRNFTVVHGGVVARENQALIISGPAGSGKTTLVTALMDAGFQFLSDDFCPFNEGTGLVHPFPRTMWRVPENSMRDSVPDGGNRVGYCLRAGKMPISLDLFKTQIESKPCKPVSAIYIDPGNHEDAWRITRIRLSAQGEEMLLKAAGRAEGFEVEKRRGNSQEWEIRSQKHSGHAQNIIALMKSLEPYTLNKYRVDSFTPDFQAEPSLQPVASHEMAHMLLGELKSEPDRLRMNPGRYFMKLTALLAGTACWRLTPGKLEAMKSLAISAFNMNFGRGPEPDKEPA
jgi:hypothetical protein